MPLFSDSHAGLHGYQAGQTILISADGVVPITPQRIQPYALAQGGVALALTIGVPAPADYGKILILWAEDVAAHVITQAAVGFNGKGAAGTATWAAAVGNSTILVAHRGNWWSIESIGVTFA